MGATKNAIVGKAHRLDLPPRPDCIIRNGTPRVRVVRVPRVPPAAATLPPLPSRQEPVVVVVPPKAPGHANRASASHTPSIFDNVVYRPVVREAPRLPMPTTKTCQYPVAAGTIVGYPWLFCEAAAEVRSYCLIHARKCFAVRTVAA
jgi:GcrA cell cycle regulator